MWESDGGMRARRVRNVLPWASVVVLGALTAGGGWLGASEQGPPPALVQTVFTFGRNDQLTRFAGYEDAGAGPFTQISGEWRVPRVLSGSASGGASEWVGLLSMATRAFIQLGTKEVVSGGVVASTSYRAVWSDTRFNFKSQPLMVVRPGDVIQANMRRVSRGWRLHLTDVTLARSVDFVVHFGAHARFTTADWLEENSSGPFATGPFPRLTPFTCRALRLNDAVVPLRDTNLEPAILQAPNNIDLVPSGLHNQSFTNKAPSGSVKFYVHPMASFSIAVETFLSDWAQSAQASDPVRFPTQAVTPQTTSAIAELVARTFSTEAVAAAKQVYRAVERLREHFSRLHFPAKDRQPVFDLLHNASMAVGSAEAAVARYRQTGVWTLQELHDLTIYSVGVDDQVQRLAGCSDIDRGRA